jgi:hypothetical protein
VAYVALAAVALAFWHGSPRAPYAVAIVVTALILLSVRNEWDLVTWLAPRKDDAQPSSLEQKLTEQG